MHTPLLVMRMAADEGLDVLDEVRGREADLCARLGLDYIDDYHDTEEAEIQAIRDEAAEGIRRKFGFAKGRTADSFVYSKEKFRQWFDSDPGIAAALALPPASALDELEGALAARRFRPAVLFEDGGDSALAEGTLGALMFELQRKWGGLPAESREGAEIRIAGAMDTHW